MTEAIKELQTKFNTIANQIEYNLKQFEFKTHIDKKYLVLLELNNLIKQLDEQVK
jgi:hypothetical protein